MKGRLIGIGVGPGDPEMLTLKAVRCLKECDILAVPDADKGMSTAYNIARQAVPELETKAYFSVVMPMTHDREKLYKSHRTAADLVEKHLNDGKTVGFITLGDPTVYSTYMYVHQLVVADGYESAIVSGVTSFCAAAAKLNISLAERAEMLHVIPSSHNIEEGIRMPGTKVLMKAGSKMATVKRQLIDSGMDVRMVENCGLPGEKVYGCAEDIPENAGYFSLIIAKDRK
jgi:precorrin-2/cobalt-factor-2 C20-methyltransferase